MKKITFEAQMMLGMIVLGIGHLLWYLTDIGSFVNLGFLFCGFLFLFHPVPPESVRNHPKSTGYVRLAAVVLILTGLTMNNGRGESKWRWEVSKATGLYTRQSTVVSAMDDHGGFQGDGSAYVILDFSEKPLLACPDGDGWQDLPMTENVSALIYGSETENGSRSPQPREPLPRVEHGFWFFYDRQGKSHSDEAVFDRYSYNYDFALYDLETDRLYYFEHDT